MFLPWATAMVTWGDVGVEVCGFSTNSGTLGGLLLNVLVAQVDP